MLLHKATKVEVTDSTIGTTATAVFTDTAGTTQFTVVNDHGSNTLYVGWDSTLDGSDPATYFVGGNLATTESIVISGYVGPIFLRASAGSTDFRVERRSVARS